MVLEIIRVGKYTLDEANDIDDESLENKIISVELK
jgi:hypothetical protein